MEYEDIMGMVVTELMERGFQQQRKEDPNLGCLIRQHVKMHDQLESVLDEESKQLFAEYHKIFTEIDGYQEKYIYIQGAKDCVMLLKSLGAL